MDEWPCLTDSGVIYTVTFEHLVLTMRSERELGLGNVCLSFWLPLARIYKHLRIFEVVFMLSYFFVLETLLLLD